MVDAEASTTGQPQKMISERSPLRAQRTETATLLDIAAYSSFAAGKVFAPAQSPVWVHEWIRHSDHDNFIVLVRLPNGGQIALPLEIAKFGPLKTARFMGNRHANGNFPPSEAVNGAIDAASIIAAVKSVRPDVSLVLLERMAHTVNGTANPLAHLPQQQSPNVSLAVDLDGGFDALLERSSGKRKRKKHRSQTRKFEAVGAIRRFEANTPEEVRRVLDSFFELKALRFKELGLADVFAEDETKSFFRALFMSALSHDPKPFALQALEVGGRLRAITGTSRSADRLICEFGAIANDDLAHASPGDFLFFENIRQACDQGFAVYDFSVGDEPYKRLWCDLEEHQFDVRLATSFSGQLLAGALGAAASAKRAIKANPILWSAIKRIRRSKSPAVQTTPADEN